ncbi:hypothetical protein AWB80_02903 [Caballeronia pedi]|uniref:Uncharacterized protein n=1 Tax=Caballeronia pedi TaxID=1777141 RepID=A0A158B0E4_9BURK|nr:hypothetical protein AWB80_02903 [Caballeronia pedi]
MRSKPSKPSRDKATPLFVSGLLLIAVAVVGLVTVALAAHY